MKLESSSKSFLTLIFQIQLSSRDFENEKLDRQSLQHQLHKVLKELRKAREQITRLESAVSPLLAQTADSQAVLPFIRDEKLICCLNQNVADETQNIMLSKLLDLECLYSDLYLFHFLGKFDLEIYQNRI